MLTKSGRMHRAHTGFSLLEVLVALIVLSLGFLAIGAMILSAHKANVSSYLQQQAVQSAYDVIDRMRANRDSALAGAYTLAPASSVPAPAVDCATVACTPTAIAQYDLWQWLTQLRDSLPAAVGSIGEQTASGQTTVTVTVQWDDSPAQRALGAAGQPPASYTLKTIL